MIKNKLAKLQYGSFQREGNNVLTSYFLPNRKQIRPLGRTSLHETQYYKKHWTLFWSSINYPFLCSFFVCNIKTYLHILLIFWHWDGACAWRPLIWKTGTDSSYISHIMAASDLEMPTFQYKGCLSRYMDSHYKDYMIVRPSYLL